MKKKLLITTAALSLSVTSLAPVTSFAATQSKNDSSTDITTFGPWEERKDGAKKIGIRLGEKHLNEIAAAIRQSGKKLGYLKGDKVTIVLPPGLKIHSTGHSNNDWQWISETLAFTGSNTLKSLSTYPGSVVNMTYDKSTHSVLLERMQNKDSTNLGLNYSADYGMKVYFFQWPSWQQAADEFGTLENDVKEVYQLGIYEEAPKLEVDPYKNIPDINERDIANLKPKDYFDVVSHAGNVTAEFVKKPDPTHIGEQTATIRVWDEYGEEDRNDPSHNTTFDVKFNVKDSTNWETEDLHGWNFIPYEENKVKRVKDSGNSLTGDYAMYSTGAMSAYKEYHLEPGATYKFTTFIKPKHVNQDDLILLTLNGNGEQRVLLGTSPNTLPSVEKGFKKLSHEFTVKSGEENPRLFFDFKTNQEFFIDSFELERVK